MQSGFEGLEVDGLGEVFGEPGGEAEGAVVVGAEAGEGDAGDVVEARRFRIRSRPEPSGRLMSLRTRSRDSRSEIERASAREPTEFTV